MSSAARRTGALGRWLPSFLLTAALAPAARAQSVGGSAAQALFEEARLLMQSDRLSEACPKFAESQRLEAALGTLLNLALCHEREGKTATAYLEYSDAVALSVRDGDEERKALSEQRIAALEPRLIRLTLVTSFAQPPGFWVSLDGVRLEAAALGVALPIDPGPHWVRYGANERREKALELSASESELRLRVALRELDPLPARKRALTLVSPRSAPSRFDTRRLVASACLGGGFVALALGAYAGFEAGSEWDKRNQHCVGGACDRQAKIFGENAQRFALLSDVSLLAGAAAAGVGIYLFATPKDGEKQPLLKVALTARPHCGVAMEGRF